MTAKQRLRKVIDEFSEAEAADALDLLIARRARPDALDELLAGAPLDEEPTTAEENAGAREAKEQVARGEVYSAEQIKRDLA